MARVVDLGWQVARCDGEELELMEPEAEDTPAKSMRLQGFENIITLRDFLSDCIADEEQRQALTRETVLPGVDNGGGVG